MLTTKPKVALPAFARGVLALLPMLVLGGCAGPGFFQPSPEQTAASYKRIYPVAQAPEGDIGTINDSAVSLFMTPHLEWAQARKQCDQKPIVHQKPAPYGYPGQRPVQRPLPPCRGTAAARAGCELGRAISGGTESPPKPETEIRYSADCYMAAPPKDALGKLQLRVVDSGMTQNFAAGQILGQVELAATGETFRIPLPDSLSGAQCLVLTDYTGNPVRVREASGNAFTFATEQMVRSKTAKALESQIASLQNKVSLQNGKMDNLKAALAKEPGWKGDRCGPPAMRSQPPMPAGGLSWENAVRHAQGYCFEKLSNNFIASLVHEYVIATEEREYIESYATHAASRNSCTRKAYDYDPNVMMEMRLTSKFKPREIEKVEVMNLLHQCTNSVINRCASHLIAWKREVESIKEEPKLLHKSCSDKLVDFLAEGTILANTAKELRGLIAKREAYDKENRLNRKAPIAVPLSQAICDARL